MPVSIARRRLSESIMSGVLSSFIADRIIECVMSCVSQTAFFLRRFLSYGSSGQLRFGNRDAVLVAQDIAGQKLLPVLNAIETFAILWEFTVNHIHQLIQSSK